MGLVVCCLLFLSVFFVFFFFAFCFLFFCFSVFCFFVCLSVSACRLGKGVFLCSFFLLSRLDEKMATCAFLSQVM